MHARGDVRHHRLTIVLVVFSMILSAGVNVPGTEAAGGSFGGGDGSIGNPYVIEDVWDLQNMSSNRSAHYVLKNDIDASDTANWNSGEGFVPVGTSYPNYFLGSLDGGNHTITGLYINRSRTDFVGLFGDIFTGGWVKDVALIDCDITGRRNVGTLAGSNRGTVSNCSAQGNVHGYQSTVGILVGDNDDGTISDSSAEGNVSGTDSVGVLAGGNSGEISHSHATGNVVATGRGAGGLVGDSSGTVSNCTASVNVNGYDRVGGLVGMNHLGVVSHSRATGDVYGTLWMGGLVGYNADGVVNASHASGNVTGIDDCVGGLVGRGLRGTMSNSSATGNVTGGNEVGGLLGDDLNVTLSGCHATGDVKGWGAVGGLVGAVIRYSIVSLCYATGNVTGTNYVGGLVGKSMGTLTDSYSTGNVTGTGSLTGGLLGKNNNGTVSYCHSSSNVAGNVYVGGLVGFNEEGEVTSSYTSGFVTGDSDVGGLVGYNSGGEVSCSYSIGNVTGETSIGGFAGRNGGTVSDSYSRGTVTRSSGTSTHFGGFVGFNNIAKVLNCYSTGRVVFDGATDPTDKGFAGVINTGPNYVMSGNFWDVQTSKQTGTSGHADGKTTAQMKTRSTFTGAGWDFNGVWFIKTGVTYPLLRWQDTGPPTAHAGPNQTIDEDILVTFDGSGSIDDLGIADYVWTFVDGAPKTLRGRSPTRVFNTPGVYEVTLNVTDPGGNWDTDTTTITVRDITPPVPDAGPDQTVDEGTEVSFNGNASSDNVGIASYRWTFVHDGSDITLWGDEVSFLFLLPGEYEVILKVMDDQGLWDIDHMTVGVLDRTPPSLEVDSPVEDELTRNATYTVTGSTEPLTRVDIRVESSEGSRDYTLTSSGDGSFEMSIGLFEGIQHVLVTATDTMGNPTVVTRIVTLDTIPPDFIINSPDTDYVLTHYSRYNIMGTMIFDPDATVFIHLFGIAHTGVFQHVVELDEGVNLIEVKAVDEAGNEKVVVLTIVRDSIVPFLTVTSPPEDYLITNDPTIHFSGTVTGAFGVVLQHKGIYLPAVLVTGSWEDGEWEYDLELGPQDLEQDVVVIAYDLADNEAIMVINVRYDFVPPQLWLEGEALSYTNQTTFTISGTTDEVIQAVLVNGVEEPVVNGLFSVDVDLTDGQNAFVVTVEDEAGNLATEIIQIFLDRVPPTFELDYPKKTDKKKATISGTCSNDVVTMLVNGRSNKVDNGTYEVEVDLKEDGKNQFIITFQDRAGNTVTETITIRKGEETPGFGGILSMLALTVLVLAAVALRRRGYLNS